MKIEIIDFDDKITLSDEQLDNPNFVDVLVEDNEFHTKAEMSVSIDELYSAVLAFKNLKNERKEM